MGGERSIGRPDGHLLTPTGQRIDCSVQTKLALYLHSILKVKGVMFKNFELETVTSRGGILNCGVFHSIYPILGFCHYKVHISFDTGQILHTGPCPYHF